MFSLLRWISGSSLWFSSLLIRILSTTGWLLGIQGKSSIKGQDVESGQDVLAAGVVSLSCRLVHLILRIRSLIGRYMCRTQLRHDLRKLQL